MDKFRLLISIFTSNITPLLSVNLLYSQVIDTFSDGNFTSRISCAGNITNWQLLISSTINEEATNSFSLGLDAKTTASWSKYFIKLGNK